MHAIEKILARASGRGSVKAGEIITASVDFAEINDLYLQTLRSFDEIGGENVWDKDRVAFVFDHYAPCPTIRSAGIHKEMREFAASQGLTYHFDIDQGVCHQVMAEAGVICPGSVVVATDSHTTLHGAFGAFGTGIGATDMATVMATGKLWFRVPEIIEIRLEGTPGPHIYPKDVILYVLGQMKADGAVYKGIDFTGPYVDQLDVAGRMVMCNMAVEMGAKCAYMQPNAGVLRFIDQRAQFPYEIQYTDEDYQYAERHVFCLDGLTPQIAAPHSVDNVVGIESVGKVRIDQAFIGSCTGGRTEDIAVAAEILRGKHIPRFCRLIVIPASAAVFQECMERGFIRDLMEAGAAISTPGCGPCLGAHEGVLAPGETAITATNRNFPGRMGSTGADIYLASPATVAASALTGMITDVRTL